MLLFCVHAVATVPLALRRYRHEVWRLLAEIAFGKGLLTVAASTVFVSALLSAVIGVQARPGGPAGPQRRRSRPALRPGRRRRQHPRAGAPHHRLRPRRADGLPVHRAGSARCGSAARSTRWTPWPCPAWSTSSPPG
ncbi:hypothetical protein G5V59_07435 [Nocardioides sp. W3-2-3]|uniref:hypothetical protein n=1 Tax=Nocardioides convexus TaxID=2712224 RepID=UPI00241846A3|nr:hypothetical protein [Nocardioides convexus]NHA00077.1 hypothetical protein [Nocardioides convexus]